MTGDSKASARVHFIAGPTRLAVRVVIQFSRFKIWRRGVRGSLQRLQRREYNSHRAIFELGYKEKSLTFSDRYPYITNSEAWIKQHHAFKTVLDWGGGDGLNSLFRDADSTVYIHEISGVTPMYGTRRYCENNVNIDFDLVTCNQVLEHVPEPLKILEEFLRLCLQKLGFILTCHSKKLCKEMQTLRRALSKKHWHEHINFFSAKGIKKLVDMAGLNSVGLRAVSATNKPGEDLIFQVLCNKETAFEIS